MEVKTLGLSKTSQWMNIETEQDKEYFLKVMDPGNPFQNQAKNNYYLIKTLESWFQQMTIHLEMGFVM